MSKAIRGRQVPELPDDWRMCELGDLVTHHSAGIYKKSDLYGEGTNIVGVSDLYRANFIDGQEFRRVPLTDVEKQRYLLSAGDLIYGESSLVREGIGRTLCVTENGAGTAFAWHTRRFKVKQKEIDSRFLYYLLSAYESRRQITSVATQTALTGITTKDFFGTTIGIPRSVHKQRKIARILTTLDELIVKSEALIAKYQVIKQGLMHDLLTRGVDEHGQLRPSYEDAPELYKDSELGWIPKEWDVVSLNDEIDIIHGYAFQGEYFADSPPGEVLLVPGNFHRDGGLYFTEGNKKYYRGPVPSQTVLTNGDLVIVMTDLSPRTLILGRVAEIDLDFQVLHNQRIGLIRRKQPATWNNKYLLFAMNSERLRKAIILSATGTTVRHTSPTKILANSIPKAPLAEQKIIASRLGHVDVTVLTETCRVEKLRELKSGLMQDLLTGDVEVPVSQE